ncbi:MAG TPA: diphosphate--fructose-6-phosphate 1-phosphotransferase [Myxococcota bacterium]|jgi:6-phosphofructokinase 1|nr:diphosphate--fructose-6-phosphate 1-phosphotransferase [Myxococcota bacterium]
MTTFGIVVGGGPAPGINGVIGAAAQTALAAGHRVIGILDGMKHVMEGDASHVVELKEEQVARIHLQGGSILHTSRANPTKKAELLENVVKSLDSLGVTHLVTIGGDDTAFSAKRVADTAAGRIKVAHVPKTIDNDLPLPQLAPTFGFETAREHATTVVERILEDTRTTGRWFFIIMMGRKAGHLALGAGKSAGATITLIPEEWGGAKIKFDEVVRVLEGSIVKRLAQGAPDGVAVIAEGVAEYLDPEELEALKDAPRDEHGHVRLAEVPLGKVLRTAVADALAARGVKVQIGDKDVGYELRCGQPTAFDRDYTRDLGVGAVRTLLAGQSSVLITRQQGKIVPIPFAELMDPATGRTKVRLVDVDTDSFRNARSLQTRVTKDDLADSGKLAALAKAAKLTPEEAKVRYAVLL